MNTDIPKCCPDTFDSDGLYDLYDSNLSKYDFLHMSDQAKCSPHTHRSLPQIPCRDPKLIPGLFHTDNGYCGGFVMCQQGNQYHIIITKDEFGSNTVIYTTIKKTDLVRPIRKKRGQIYINTCPSNNNQIVAEGYIKTGQMIDSGGSIGSGVPGTVKHTPKSVKYPIYTPLTLHNLHHHNTLMYASSFLIQIIDEYLKTNKVSSQLLEQATWLINVVLSIDDFPKLNKDVIFEALLNFCVDYTMFNSENLVRQPINYVFDILGIDGVTCPYQDLSISYIHTDFEGIMYRTVDDRPEV